MTHFYVEGIRLHVSYTHASKSECQTAIIKFIALARHWLGLDFRAFRFDHERSVGTVEQQMEEEGFVVEHSTVATPEQNAYSERAGGVIITRARALGTDAGLPLDLWPEFVAAAVYIINRTPVYDD